MSQEPGWDLYRSFLAVVDEASLSGAARALGLTQPTVARHVEALETAVGAALFVRSNRGLVPTEAAEPLIPHARTIAASAAALLRAAGEEHGRIAGTVRVSAAEVVGIRILPPILAALRRRHPDLQIELALTDAVEDLLRRDADVAVRMVDPVEEALVARKAGVAELGFHARRDYLDRRGTPATLEELAGHDLVGFDRETPAIRALLRRFPLPVPSFALRTDSNVAQLAAIEAGFGIGICQVSIAAEDPRLVRVLPDALAMTLPVWIVMHEDVRASLRCRAVFDALADGCGRRYGTPIRPQK